MEVTYGHGTFVEGQKRIQGRIILSEHKVYLKGPKGDLIETYIPLEKICLVKKTSKRIHFEAQLTIHLKVSSMIEGDDKSLLDMAKEIAKRRGLKKKFLKQEWVEEA